MEATIASLEEIAEEARAFRDDFQSIQLATAASGSAAVASYAPFAFSKRGGFFIYVSELAAHTSNLRDGGDVGVLFVEEESKAANIFARRRLSVTCSPEHLPRGDSDFDEAIHAMTQRFGETMNYLATLKDFHAFELVPREASYVKGFAQAYEFPDAQFDQIRHINDKGHDDS